MNYQNPDFKVTNPKKSAFSASVLPDDILGATFDALPDAIYVFDRERYLDRFNHAALLMQGPANLPLAGRRCCKMFWGVDEEGTCIVDRAIESNSHVQVEMLAGPHETQPTLLIVQPLNHRGEAGAIVLARDISELRQAEAEALDHKAFMISVADRSPDEIYTLDRQGRISWMNGRAEQNQLLMLAGRYFNEFIASDSHELTNNNLQRSLNGEESQFEVRAIRTDGTMRYVEAHTSPLWKDGNVTGVLVFLRDVTDRKQAQEVLAQSDKLRAVGELAAGVAHNLNNSLTVIQGRAQLMLMRGTDEPTTKNLRVINNAVEEGAKTLRRILDFARRETVQEFAPVELTELISSSIEVARPKWQSQSARENGAEIKVTIANGDPVYVLGEVAELREVVLNLIFNAVDAMPDGGIMEVGTRAEVENGCFWVADTGCGMSPESVARIFEPFYTTKGMKGTGLGLSASHGIITRHKGQIMVVSQPGEGTRFEVRLPICENEARFVREFQSESQDDANADDLVFSI